MLRFLSKSLLVLIMGALAITMLLPAGTSVRAQDGLSDEEIATLDRLEAAIDNFTAYTSYTSYVVELESQVIAVSISGFDLELAETTNREITGAYINADGVENIQAEALVTTQNSDGTSGTETAATIQAEVRVVDGTVYVMAEYLDSEGTVPDLPAGWIVVDEMNVLQYDFLDIGDLIESATSEATAAIDDSDLFDDRELLESSLESVTVDPIELEDGTLVDLITLTLGPEGFTQLLGDTLDLGLGDESGMAEMMDAMFEGISFNFQVALDADDNVRQTVFTLTINVEDLDASFIPEVPEGMEASLSISMDRVETTTYSDINADLEPVAAPE
jgi:hypothetical protein